MTTSLLNRQIPQDPLGAPEPLELHRPLAVVKHRDQSAPSGATHFLGLGDDTLHFDGSVLALNVYNAVKLAAVFVPKRQVQEQVHARPNAQLRNKGAGPFGPDAFEKFTGSGWEHQPWLRQVTSFPRQTNIKTGFSKFCFDFVQEGRTLRRPPHGGRSSRSPSWPGTTAPSRTTGTAWMPPTARMHASGGLMMAVNSSMPNMPRFEIVKVLPSQSLGWSFLSLAFWATHGLPHQSPKGLHVRVAHHRHEQAIFDGHGHTDVDVLVVANAILQPAAVHSGVILERHRHSLHNHVVEGPGGAHGR